MTLRLATKLWVSAQVSRCQAAGIGVYVLQKGDPERGGLLIKHRFGADATMLYEPAPSMDHGRDWIGVTGNEPVAEAQVDEKIARRRRYDPDVWIIEIDDPRRAYILPDDPP